MASSIDSRYDRHVVKKQRLDVVITERGLVPSRARAQSLILAGIVRLDGEVETKAGTQVGPDAVLEIIEPDHPWVSRGALKLVAALDEFNIEPDGIDCLDVGASTGGFTDVLLERGAKRVIALDVGRGQLDWRLRNDPRVVVMEGVNARHLDSVDLPFVVALATIDVSFISLRLVVPALRGHLIDGARLVCLVKPQFEAGRDAVGSGGRVRDEAARSAAIARVRDDALQAGFEVVAGRDCTVAGARAGNVEHFLHLRRATPAP